MGCLSRLLLLLLAASLIWPAVIAPSPQQTDACPAVARLALETTNEVCEGIGQNQACYGHVLVEATLRPSDGQIVFNQAGDTTDLLDLESLRLSSMDLDTGLWGVALMNLQAYMQYASPEEVTFLLFGDVEVENQVEPARSLEVTVAASSYINVRLAPSMRAGVLGTLAPGQTITAQGRLADGSWVRVTLPESGRVGWVSRDLITSQDDLETLGVVEAQSSYYGPMQAFALRSGVDDSLCPQAPDSGLLIQTPEGVAEVTLLVNEVNIQLSSATAFVQARPGGEMTVNVLDGWVQVEANGVQQTGFAGTQVSVPLGEDLIPTGPPDSPEPYAPSTAQAMPVQLLSHPVTVAQPLTPAEIAQLLAGPSASSSGQGGNQNRLGYTEPPPGAGEEQTPGYAEPPPGLGGEQPPGQGGTPPGLDGGSPPGQGGTPPGLGGDVPPGQGGTPPGQGETPPSCTSGPKCNCNGICDGDENHGQCPSDCGEGEHG